MSQARSGPPARVAVILINWNSYRETVACIRSLERSETPVWRIYVVDNASEDASVEHIRRQAPQARLIRSRTNAGYAGGFNLAWPVALEEGADWVWLLNNDTLVTGSALPHLLQASEAVEQPALLAPQIRFRDRPDEIWYLGGKLDWRMKTTHVTERNSMGSAKALPVEWATGCSLFLAGRTLASLGGMDERYFLYLEDADWSLSARRRGVGVYVVPQAIVHHGLAASVERLEPWHVHYYSWRNYYLFATTHGAWWQKAYAYGDLLLRLLKTAVRLLLYPSYRRDLNYLARSRGLVDFTIGRFGALAADGPPRLTLPHWRRSAT